MLRKRLKKKSLPCPILGPTGGEDKNRHLMVKKQEIIVISPRCHQPKKG